MIPAADSSGDKGSPEREDAFRPSRPVCSEHRVVQCLVAPELVRDDRLSRGGHRLCGSGQKRHHVAELIRDAHLHEATGLVFGCAADAAVAIDVFPSHCGLTVTLAFVMAGGVRLWT